MPLYVLPACVTCNRAIQEGIYNSQFYPNLFQMFSAFLVLGLILIVLTWLSTRKHQALVRRRGGVMVLNPVPLTTAAMVIGIGLGGFVDGIVFHQMLQWHNMLSHKLPPDDTIAKSVNMFWDGIFHAFCLLATLLGIILLFRALRREAINKSARLLGGGIVAGWGLFNIVEGIIDHHILRLHLVREITPNPDLWNYGFLGFSVLLFIVGFLVMQRRIPKERHAGE